MATDSKIRPLVIAGAASGVGKTTVAVGIMGALRRRGLAVAPFKSGPDYIDPSYHMAASRAPSRNLDTWMTSPEAVREIYSRGSAGFDVSVIEGAMGLFDGRAGARNEGSTAEIASLLGGAVVLVADCARTGRSLAALLSGYARFDERVPLAGAILNNAGSPAHARMLEDAAREAGVPVIGVLPRCGDISLKSRHLGLLPAGEAGNGSSGHGHGVSLDETLGRITDHVEEHLDIDALLTLAGAGANSGSLRGEQADRKTNSGKAGDTIPLISPIPDSARGRRPRIAVACDEAFSFYYVDSLEALGEAGAELVYFSPLRDAAVPACDGLYLGGGFPEVYASELEANTSMRHSLASATREGLPLYAECGGLIYLCRGITGEDGNHREMAGVLPLEARMTGKRQALGYVEARALKDSVLLAKGEKVRGHEFRWSEVEWSDALLAYECFSSREGAGKHEGFCDGNILASYVHLHFAGNRGAAARFIHSCAGKEGAAIDATA